MLCWTDVCVIDVVSVLSTGVAEQSDVTGTVSPRDIVEFTALATSVTDGSGTGSEMFVQIGAVKAGSVELGVTDTSGSVELVTHESPASDIAGQRGSLDSAPGSGGPGGLEPEVVETGSNRSEVIGTSDGTQKPAAVVGVAL